MGLLLSDMEYLLLARSLHTRDILTIAHSIFGIERLLHHLKLLLRVDYEPQSSPDVQRPAVEYQQSEDNLYSAFSPPNQGITHSDLVKAGALDLTIKPSISQFLSQQTREDRGTKKLRPRIILSPNYNSNEILPLNLTTASQTYALFPASSKQSSTHDDDSADANLSPEGSTCTMYHTRNLKTRPRIRRLNNTNQGYTFPSKRPIKCNICGKEVRADNFQVHQRSHTGEKPFKCPKCPFRSANPSSMPKHLRLHDKPRKIYTCSKCSYATIYKSNLSTHQRTHHPSNTFSKMTNASTDSTHYRSNIQVLPNPTANLYQDRNTFIKHSSATDNNNDINNNHSSITSSN